MIDKKLLNTKEYDFLRTNPHLGDKIMFLVVGGSHAYGTNIETSDVDIRGVCLPEASDVLGLTSFEQVVEKKTDTTIYSLPKFIELVSNCNPNVIELLFARPEDYLYVSPEGQFLLDHRDLFLTKRAYYTFGGYAHSQLNRLENALARNGEVLNQEELQVHINRSMINSTKAYIEKCELPENSFKTYVDNNTETMEAEIYCDFNLKKVPLRILSSYLRNLEDIKRNYAETPGNANKKKDDLHLNKHMMHLMRLYLMAREILRDGSLHVYRDGEEHKFLMDVRNGLYRTENGGVKKEFYDILHKLEAECEEYNKTCTLPKRVDKEQILNILTTIYKEKLFV